MTETFEKKGMTYTQNFRKKFIHWNFFLRNFRDF